MSAPEESVEKRAFEIGWEFVQEYYTIMHHEPESLYKFYGTNSYFCYGLEGESTQYCHGKEEIRKRIGDIDYKECRVVVSNVDSQPSNNGGIIVQVLGEMLNRDEQAIKFAQTFFLAVQQNGYYVLNDIFRNLKDEVNEESAKAQAAPAQKSAPTKEAAPATKESTTEAPKPTAAKVAAAAEKPAASTATNTTTNTTPAQNRPISYSSVVSTPSNATKSYSKVIQGDSSKSSFVVKQAASVPAQKHQDNRNNNNNNQDKDSYTVFIKLPFTVSKEEISNALTKFGDIKNVEINTVKVI
ncbi:NTF2-like protein [Neocallimastix californiae]|uniref:NTF2-like protein n=1 Tax=Neocallimastix californiae TaxID=1754190 RepID=A0A1Y2FJ85_9FUNG|nr:NTF2-like protein [Neocallimastix californiae]|eukprot:ORY83998.1 NTF2-like protein [Neocallimastix californiae]